MDIESTTNNDTKMDDADVGPASLPTALPAPPRLPTFMPRVVSMAQRRPSLTLVCSNPTPSASRATVPNLRVVKMRKVVHSTPPSPPSIPPTGSTPIHRAA